MVECFDGIRRLNNNKNNNKIVSLRLKPGKPCTESHKYNRVDQCQSLLIVQLSTDGLIRLGPVVDTQLAKMYVFK